MIFLVQNLLKANDILSRVPNDSRQTKDPDTFGWRRWGKYRCVLLGGKQKHSPGLFVNHRQTARRPRLSERWLWSHHHHRRLRLGMTRLTRRLPISNGDFLRQPVHTTRAPSFTDGKGEKLARFSPPSQIEAFLCNFRKCCCIFARGIVSRGSFFWKVSGKRFELRGEGREEEEKRKSH